MMRVQFEVTEEQAREIMDSIDELDDGEKWEPDMSFSHDDAQAIRTKLYYQIQARYGR